MKNFILKCLLFFAVFFVLEKSLILVRNSAPERELDKRLEFILNGKIDADILVFGSSRGARDIIASNIGDSLHASAYNLSYPGSSIAFHDYLLTTLHEKKNKIPKLIILAVDDPYELVTNGTINFRFDRLYPLVKYESVRETLVEKGEKDRVLSNLFIVHQLGLSNFDFRKKHFDDQDTLLADGSMPISYQGKKFNRVYFNSYKNYDSSLEDSVTIGYFNHFLQLCEDNNTKVLLALAPNFGHTTLGFEKRMEDFVKDNQVSLLMYDTSNAIYKNPDYFFDAGHLQKNGADVFTAEIIDQIKQQNLYD